MSQLSRIYCVCGGFGFPVGAASTNRILLMGRALLSAGITFHVWHLGPSSFPENKQKSGEHQGISWDYLSPSVKRPENKWLRMFYFLWGCLVLPFVLMRGRRGTCVYLYYQGDAINLWVLVVCRILGIPVAQECCEWWPGTPNESRFNRWMYRRIMFRWSDGALPISTLIEKRIREVSRKGYSLLRIPILVDAEKVQQETTRSPYSPGTDQPFIFWCGVVDGYFRDPQFLIRALGAARQKHEVQARLVLAGPCSDAAKNELMREAANSGLEPDQVIITGFIPEDELFRLATHAAAALLPLWDDDRSRSRFPTKLGLYVAAGRPIVTSAIGEIVHYLQDKETALFAAPDDEVGWGDAIDALMKDQVLCVRLGARMEVDVLPRFDYQEVGEELKSFYNQISDHPSQ
ncbi:MAG: glycosyltransferase family 4 protein [Candidatus Aminicenantes bacterium]|nr:glycosyltransferase family 4 protein [Candidatus Aminicenantes bacterium]